MSPCSSEVRWVASRIGEAKDESLKTRRTFTDGLSGKVSEINHLTWAMVVDAKSMFAIS